MKWKPKIEFVEGDKFPWKAYAVKGKKKELIASFCKEVYNHCFISAILKDGDFSEKLKKDAIDGFYKSCPKLSRSPYSGKIEAEFEAKCYCNMANKK